MKYLRNSIFIFVVWFTVGCMPTEDNIPPTPRLNQSLKIDHGPLRNDVVFVSLEKNEIVQTISPYTFEIYGNERGVFLNGFKNMRAAKIDVPIDEYSGAVDELEYKYLTMGYEVEQWLLENDVNYILDMGMDEDGNSFGKIKFRYEVNADATYQLYYMKLNGNNELKQTKTISSDFGYSFKNQKFVEIPLESEYDLIFGKYTDFVTFVSISIDYIVSGTIQNFYTEAKLIDKPFENVTLDDFTEDLFENQHKREIGWDWKRYDIDKAAYTIDENKTYLIQTKSNLKIKFRFVDFYNSVGISGHPTLEFVIL